MRERPFTVCYRYAKSILEERKVVGGMPPIDRFVWEAREVLTGDQPVTAVGLETGDKNASHFPTNRRYTCYREKPHAAS